MRIINITIAALLLLSTVYIDAVDAQKIYPDADVQVFNGAGYENYNFGGSPDSQTGRYWDVIWRLWFKATLPVSESTESIVSAKLYLYLRGGAYTGGLDSIGAYYASNDSWTENTITWNNAPNGSVSATPDSIVTNQAYNWSNWFSWDITSSVKGENAGSVISIVLKQTDETVNGAMRGYYMTEYTVDPTLRPYIEIITSSSYAGATAVVSTRAGEGYTSIQSAIDSLPSSGGTVLIKEGTYTITTPIKVRDNVTLKGMGCNTTRIVTSSNTINGIETQGTVDVRYVKIANLFLQGSASGWGTNIGIDLNRASNCVVENCIVSNFQKGIWIRKGACYYNLVSNAWVYVCEDGIMIGDTGVVDDANEQKIEYGRIWLCTRGLNVIKGDNVTVFGVAFEAETEIGVKTNGRSTRIIGNRFESQTPNATAIYVDTGARDTDILSNLMEFPLHIVDKGTRTFVGFVPVGKMADTVQENLVKNGSFEDWVGSIPAYWSTYGVITVSQGEPGIEGTKSVSLNGAVGQNYLGQIYTIPSYMIGKSLSISVRAKLVTSTQANICITDTADGAQRTCQTITSNDGTGWKTLYLTFIPKASPPTSNVEIAIYPSGGSVLFDGVMMVAGDVPVGYEKPKFTPQILANKTVNSSQTTIPHGLGRIPSFIDIKMKSSGQIWESAPADATNIYLQADQNGKICDVYVY